MSALLQVSGLTAHYGDFQALFGVDITVAEGETIAIIGANGAGKTTLISLVLGLLAPTAGSISVLGLPRQLLAMLESKKASDTLSLGVRPEGILVSHDDQPGYRPAEAHLIQPFGADQ